MKLNRVLLSLFPIGLLVSSAVIPSVGAATSPVVNWKLSTLKPSSVYPTSSIASSNSTGKKTWSVSGSCFLKNGRITTKSAGACTVKLVTRPNGKFAAKASSKKFQIVAVGSTSPNSEAPVLGFKLSTAWGEVAVTQISGPKPGGCVDVPIKLDVRSQTGLGIGLIISMTDNYGNKIGEIRPDSPIGITNVSMHVCREAWVFTYPNGVTDNRAATLYCGYTVKFWPGYDSVRYTWNDSVCKSSSDRL